jgi:hypothetical protein
VRNRTFPSVPNRILVGLAIALTFVTTGQYFTYAFATDRFNVDHRFWAQYDSSLIEPSYLHPHTTTGIYLCGYAAGLVVVILFLGLETLVRDNIKQNAAKSAQAHGRA